MHNIQNGFRRRIAFLTFNKTRFRLQIRNNRFQISTFNTLFSKVSKNAVVNLFSVLVLNLVHGKWQKKHNWRPTNNKIEYVGFFRFYLRTMALVFHYLFENFYYHEERWIQMNRFFFFFCFTCSIVRNDIIIMFYKGKLQKSSFHHLSYVCKCNVSVWIYKKKKLMNKCFVSCA